MLTGPHSAAVVVAEGEMVDGLACNTNTPSDHRLRGGVVVRWWWW